MTGITSSCSACGATYRGRVEICPNCSARIEEDSSFRPGTVIDGKYEVLSLLAVGGMGQVFKVRHLHLDALRTIKKLRKDLLEDASYRARFAREARMATLVQHPNVAIVHDFATLADGTSYIVSEFIEGVTLRQWMQTHGRFSRELALQIGIQTLSGLESIHRAGLVHRDISPDNLMIATGADGRPLAKIIDLGIAKATDAETAEGTQVGIYVGNPRYSSPEQLGALRDGETIDARVDLYCIGGVLYELLTGSAPFESSTPHGYAVMHLTKHPASLRMHNPALPEGLDNAVLKALEKDRERRYRTAREMRTALAPFVKGELTERSQLQLESLREPKHPTPPPQARAAGIGVEANREDEEMERHRSERAAFHAAIDALERGDPKPAEELAAKASAQHIRQRLKTGLATFYEERAKRAGSEEAAWKQADADGTEAAWLRFIAAHPKTPRMREATSMLAETRDYARAIQSGTELALQVYIATWPRGRHMAEVAAALRELHGGARRTRSERPRPIPTTSVELIPETVASPLPTTPEPSVDEDDGRGTMWVYAFAAATAAALLIVATLWFRS